MNFIIGANGQIGQAIYAAYDCNQVFSLPRVVYQDWWKAYSQDDISRFFEPYADQNAIIFVTSGILDPRLPLEHHLNINYFLPKHIIEGATKVGMQVITFGTIMERLIENKNAYIHSKTLLGQYIEKFSTQSKQVMHLQLHTLYGTQRPHKFLFLGQICDAIKSQTPFAMSSGNQLREYHHIDDEILAIRTLVDSHSSGIVALNHGESFSLKDIATHVFKAFDCENLLQLGRLPEPKDENYKKLFMKPQLLSGISFRKTLPAIIEGLKGFIFEVDKLT